LELVVGNRIRKLETKNIIFIESIALERVDDQGCLEGVFEVGEAEVYLLSRLLFLGNQPHRLETRERPENMSYFSFRGVEGDAFHVNCVGGCFRNGHDVGSEETRYFRKRFRKLK